LNEQFAGNRWLTGLRKVDELCPGGLLRGAMTEVVADSPGCGGAFLIHCLLDNAAAENQIIALVDATDSLDVTAMRESTLARLLWVRCHSGEEAMKATDILLRDSNVSLVLLDLAAAPRSQLQKIPPTTWYRLQRLIQETTTVCLVFTPRPMISPAKNRITLESRFSLDTLDAEREKLLNELILTEAEAKGERTLPNQSIA
jgi:hypothetical protein